MAKFVFSAFADEIDADFNVQLESLNRLGIPYIELRGVNGKSFTALTDDEILDVKDGLAEHHIKVWSLGSPLGKAKTDCGIDSQLALLEKIMRTGKMLGTNHIRMFSYYPEDGDSFEVYEEKVFALIGALLDKAESRGFVLCHENEKGIYGQSPESEKKLLEHFGGRLKAVLDNGNFPFCGEDASCAYATLAEYVEYLHIKDCKRTDGESIIVPPGCGDAYIKETLSAVNKDRQGEVVITMEPHLIDFTGLSSLSNLDDIKHTYSYDTPYDAFLCATENVRRMLAEL